MTQPEAPQRPYAPRIIAHRGASAHYAEHTRAAYLHALELGADGVECDVHLTKDEQVVLHHDFTLERTSSGRGALADHTLEQLRGFDFSGWKGIELPGHYGTAQEQLLTLGDLLDLLLAHTRSGSERYERRPLLLALELKHPNRFGLRLEEKVLEELVARGWDHESSRLEGIEICFMSFDPDSIAYLGTQVGEHHLCMLVDDPVAEEIEEAYGVGPAAAKMMLVVARRTTRTAVETIETGRADVAGPGVAFSRAHADQVRGWSAAGRTLRIWTVDSEEDILWMKELGVQEITTNRPGFVREVLERARS